VATPTKITRLNERANPFTSEGFSVERDKCQINGVKLLGWESGNRRSYDPAGCSRCVEKYSGAKVNIDHGKKEFSSRFGRVIPGSPVAKTDGIYGNIRYNPKHPYAEAILWFAENDPTALGMSHDADGKASQRPDGTLAVSEIVRVHSVDIVSDPATTKGLFEEFGIMDPNGLVPAAPAPAGGDFDEHLGEMVRAVATDKTLSRKEKMAKLKQLLKLCDDEDTGDEETPKDEEESADEPEEKDEEPKDEESKKKAYEESLNKDELAKLRKELDVYKVKEALNTKRETARKLANAMLPKEAVTERFVEDLASLGDEKSMRESIEDRRTVLNLTAKGHKPTAPATGSGKMTVDDFVKELKK
jgi:hypothetical protein